MSTDFYKMSEKEMSLFEKLLGLVTNIKWSHNDADNLFKVLLNRYKSTSTFSGTDHISWMMEMLHCIEINFITSSWRSETGKTLIELVQDETVTDENLKKYLADDREKNLDEILDEIRLEKLNQVDEELLAAVTDIVSSVHGNHIISNDTSERTELKRSLQRICSAVEKTVKYKPRLTQMVSWCLLALSKSGRLIQVGTGEGKSCIVAMFAAYRAMKGQKVDIMSSSPVLAERDMKDWKAFYKHLKISVDSNTNKKHTDLKKCYKCQVVYGTVEEFAGDWLRHHFERMDIFGDRTFQCAIVDEVDSLMLDKGHHVVYIGSDMPALQHLNPLLAFIWATVNQPERKSDIEAVEAEVRRALCFTPCDQNQAQSCYVPGFLKELVNSKLKVWIENAFYAQTITKDHQYVLEKHGVVPVDYSCTGVVENFMKWTDGLQQFLEMKHESKLSDMTAITNYKSNVGLLQMYGDQIYGMSGTLGQRAETETLQKIYEGITTCQIPSFKRRKLFEVEGLVIEDEKEWTEKVCEVVAAQTKPTSYRGPRAVLLICETIARAKALHRALGETVPQKKLYINNNMDNSAVFVTNLNKGDVIIATNLAGRGTDLKVSDEVNLAGGLLVVQTFLPKNARVEAQAFGRTARQGSPGSAQIIVCTSHLPGTLRLLLLMKKLLSVFENLRDATPLYPDLFYLLNPTNDHAEALSSILRHALTKNSKSGIMSAKEVRDKTVAEELCSYLEHHIPTMKKKEELFNLYLETLMDMYKKNPEPSYLSALNEFWGLWLLTNLNEKDSITELKSRLSEDLKRAQKQLQQRESPTSNLHHYTAFGNERRKKGDLTESIKMYTKAIEQDHCWAAIAYYNRAFTSLIQKNRKQDRDCINRALEDLQNALESVQLHREQLVITHRYSKQQTNNQSRVSVTRFDQHLSVRYMLLLYFKQNITEAIQKVSRAQDMGGNVKVEENLVYFLVPMVNFLPLLAHSMESVSVIRSNDPLKAHQLISQPSYDILHELMCLESLGLTHVYTLDTMFSLGGFFSKVAMTLMRLS